jgi:hypothetical protein
MGAGSVIGFFGMQDLLAAKGIHKCSSTWIDGYEYLAACGIEAWDPCLFHLRRTPSS